MHKLLMASALALGLSAASTAHAVPSCTGTTDTVASGGTVTAAFLLTAGNCVAAGDKIFGNFATGGAEPGNGSASFTFPALRGNVTIGFSGVLNPSSTGSLQYDVEMNPANSAGFLIDDLEKDFTLNASEEAAPATATLTGTTVPATIAFDCTRTVNPVTSTCPQTRTFSPVSDIVVNESITTGTNSIVTALTDTISQVAPAVPEPASLALLGTALAGFGFFGVRRRRQS